MATAPTVIDATAGITTTSSTTTTATLPAAAANGDLLVLTMNQGSSVPIVFTPPAGWTDSGLGMITGTNVEQQVLWRVKQAGDTNPTLTSDTIAKWSWSIVAVRGYDFTGSNPIHKVASAVRGSVSAITSAPSVTPTSGDCLMLNLYAERQNPGSSTATDPAGVTRVASAFVTSGSSPRMSVVVNSFTQVSPGATGTKDLTYDQSSNNATAFTVAIAPLAGGTGVVGAITVVAPAGIVSTGAAANVAGVVANVSLTAPAGTAGQTTSVTTAAGAITVTAPAGTVTAVQNVSLTTTPAGISVAALTGGGVALTSSGTLYPSDLLFPSDTLFPLEGSAEPIVGVAAGITLAAPAGTVSANGNVVLVGPVVSISLASPAGTVTAVTSADVAVVGVVAGITFQAPAGVVVQPGSGFFFIGPTVDEGPAGNDWLFYRYKLTRGVSVIKENGVYRELRWPTQDEIAAAEAFYLGGHEHLLTSAEVDDLTAGGFGDFIVFKQGVST